MTVTASDSNTDTDTIARPKRNRFSVEMDGNLLPMEREDSQSATSIKEEEIETASFDVESVESEVAYESKKGPPMNLPPGLELLPVAKSKQPVKKMVKEEIEKEVGRSKSRRGRSLTRRSTTLRKSLDSSAEPSPCQRTPTKAPKLAHISPSKTPVKSLLTDVSSTTEILTTPVKEREIGISDTPSRRSRRDGSNRSLELVQGNLGNQTFTCKVGIFSCLYQCMILEKLMIRLSAAPRGKFSTCTTTGNTTTRHIVTPHLSISCWSRMRRAWSMLSLTSTSMSSDVDYPLVDNSSLG